VMYEQTVDRAGAGSLLAQRTINAYGHCAFTVSQMATAFDDLAGWVQTGVRPTGL